MRIAPAAISVQLDTAEHSSAGNALSLPGPEEAVLAAIAYADLFDYPLTAAQVELFQVGTCHNSKEIGDTLTVLSTGSGQLERTENYFTLAGRESLIQVRRERERVSARLWRRARLRGKWVARTPFVRMVAVTGALSMDNIFGKADIDLLVVTKPGRVWICRRLLILQVRLARLLGDDLCPNYILASNNLELDQRDFFTSHELAQMVPLYGQDIHREMLRRNGWASRYLPAAFEGSTKDSLRGRTIKPSRLLEWMLGARFFDGLEAWELSRLRRKLAPLIGEAAEVVCSPEQCKGHTGLHRSSVLARFAERLRQLGIYEPFAQLLDADFISPKIDK